MHEQPQPYVAGRLGLRDVPIPHARDPESAGSARRPRPARRTDSPASNLPFSDAVAQAIDSLRARGFGRSELKVRHAVPLSASATLVAGVALRYMVDGPELERVGVTYVLQSAANRRGIAMVIVHDPHDVERTESCAQIHDVHESAVALVAISLCGIGSTASAESPSGAASLNIGSHAIRSLPRCRGCHA